LPALPLTSLVGPVPAGIVEPGDGVNRPEWPVPVPLVDRLREARQAGFEEGRLAGLEEAAASAEVDRLVAATAAADQLARTAADVGDQRAAVVAEVASDVVALAFELVEVLVGREVALSDDPGRDAVARALALAPEGEDLVVRVHPSSRIDRAEIEQLVADPRVTVVEDPDVAAAGCLVKVGSCHIDAQIAPALARVRACLEAAAPTPAPPPPPASSPAPPAGGRR